MVEAGVTLWQLYHAVGVRTWDELREMDVGVLHANKRYRAWTPVFDLVALYGADAARMRALEPPLSVATLVEHNVSMGDARLLGVDAHTLVAELGATAANVGALWRGAPLSAWIKKLELRPAHLAALAPDGRRQIKALGWTHADAAVHWALPPERLAALGFCVAEPPSAATATPAAARAPPSATATSRRHNHHHHHHHESRAPAAAARPRIAPVRPANPRSGTGLF